MPTALKTIHSTLFVMSIVMLLVVIVWTSLTG